MRDSDRQSADPSEIRPVANRRDFIKGSLAGAASISFAALAARRAGAAELPYSDEYGPLALVNDLTTGLPLIALPSGFSYRTFGWARRRPPRLDLRSARLRPGHRSAADRDGPLGVGGLCS
jgi:uncharacterized protein